MSPGGTVNQHGCHRNEKKNRFKRHRPGRGWGPICQRVLAGKEGEPSS